MIAAFDVESTGLDAYHDARPFFFSWYDDTEGPWSLEWEVNPKTREVCIPCSNKRLVRDRLDAADTLVAQNAKFDVAMLYAIGVYSDSDPFPWDKLEDTLVAGHMLYTSRRHDLTTMVLQYLKEDIKPLEKKLQHACEAARRWVRRKSFRDVSGDWFISERGGDGMPSAKDKNWQMDMWLPLAVAREEEVDPTNPEMGDWYNVLEEYSLADSYWTLALWLGYTNEDSVYHPGMRELIRSKGLWKNYKHRMVLQPFAYGLEYRGVTGSIEGARQAKEYAEWKSGFHAEECRKIAEGFNDPETHRPYNLHLPVSGNNDSLLTFVFDVLGMPVVKQTPNGNPSFDKDVLDAYVKEHCPAESVQQLFFDNLTAKRKLDTAISYMEQYERFRIVTGPDTFVIHPSANPCGTVQLRWSFSNPNTSNISKQKGFNLRQGFGPDPEGEFWSLDAQNLELRIPTFRAQEPLLMEVFLKPKEPPYFGSYHLVIFDLLHPERFKKHGKDCKDEYDSTWYQWVKNGNFAIIYGCQRKKADATYKVTGAFDKIRDRFPNIAKLADEQIRIGATRGYVETVPSKWIDPDRGFPVMVSRTNEGWVLPTTPLNYHISATAMQWTNEASLKCEAQLDEWRRQGINCWCTLQVHDELVFRFPKSKVNPQVDLDRERKWAFDNGPVPMPFKYYRSNLGYVRVLQRLMESAGESISVPTPVGVEFNRDNWADITLKC